MELLAGIGQRFLNFCDRFGGHFRQRTRTVETSARHYVRGLLQAETKNMERMEEAIPEADHQALHPMLSESAWSERAGGAGSGGLRGQPAVGRTRRQRPADR